MLPISQAAMERKHSEKLINVTDRRLNTPDRSAVARSLDHRVEDTQQPPEMTVSTLPGMGRPCEPASTLLPGPARPAHPQTPCWGRWGGCCAGWNALASKGTTPGDLGRVLHWLGRSSAPAEPKARGSGWKQGNTQAFASDFCPLRPSFSHSDT